MRERAAAHYQLMDGRRSVRSFSADPVPLEVVRDAIRTAGTAPSGAHKQPWRFVCVRDAEVKRKIRLAAEEEAQQAARRPAPPPCGTPPGGTRDRGSSRRSRRCSDRGE